VSSLLAAGCEIVAAVRSAERFLELKRALPADASIDAVIGDLATAAGVAVRRAALRRPQRTARRARQQRRPSRFLAARHRRRTAGDGRSEPMSPPFVLSQLVLPKFAQRRPRRDSGFRRHRRVRTLKMPEDLTSTQPFTASASSALYAQSKLLPILFTSALAAVSTAAP